MSQYIVNNSYLLCLYFESCKSKRVITATERSSSNTSTATTAASPVTAALHALLMIVPAVHVLGPRRINHDYNCYHATNGKTHS